VSHRQPAAVLIPRLQIRYLQSFPPLQPQLTTSSSAATSTKTTAAEAHSLLLSQRLKRPIAPHLSIYQPQLTWILSSANRITGVLLSGSFYLFGIGYAIAPWVGLHLESSTIAASLAALPVAAKLALKGTLAFPFAFHAFNGCRHLIWDTAKELSIKGVYRTGYAVLASSAAAAVYLTFFA
jgi:succinate dehydrogenase (ubiquinone) cytochrome b560 subunit